MNIQNITDLSKQITNQIPFIIGIKTEEENEEALLLMEQLTEDYDNNLLLIDLLWSKIEEYENTAPELHLFNKKINSLDNGSSMLRLLMDQHGLNTTSFSKEIGGKSTVSMICNNRRKLTTEHIQKLSTRFGISPALFF